MSAGAPAADDIAGAIRELLEAARVPYEEIAHPPVSNAEEAARARGTPLSMGAKSIVLKADGSFCLLVLPASLRLSASGLRRGLGVRRTRFADRTELAELTGLEPGTVPPFGEPVLPLPLYADAALVELDRIAFTPGVADRSLVVPTEGWRRVARPEVVTFSRGATGDRG